MMATRAVGRTVLGTALGVFAGIGAAAASGLPLVPVMIGMGVLCGLIAYRSP